MYEVLNIDFPGDFIALSKWVVGRFGVDGYSFIARIQSLCGNRTSPLVSFRCVSFCNCVKYFNKNIRKCV